MVAIFADDFEKLHPRQGGRFVAKGTTSLGQPHVPGHKLLDDVDPEARENAEGLGFDLRQPAVRDLLSACAGAITPTDSVWFDPVGDNELKITLQRPGLHTQMVFRQFSRGLAVRLELMENDQARSGKAGVEIVANMVKSLRRLGATCLFLQAAGDPRHEKFNGYYSWPRMGFEAELLDHHLDRLPAQWKKKLGTSRSLQDLFSLGGGDAWKQYGEDIHCHFDLDPKSRSSMALERYIASRRAEFAVLFSHRDPSQWGSYVGKLGKRRGHPGHKHNVTGQVIWAEDWGSEQDSPSGIGQMLEEDHNAHRLHHNLFSSDQFKQLHELNGEFERTTFLLKMKQIGGKTGPEVDALVSKSIAIADQLNKARADFRAWVHHALVPEGPRHAIQPNPIGSNAPPDANAFRGTVQGASFISSVLAHLPGEPPVPQPDVFYASSAILSGMRAAYMSFVDTLIFPAIGLRPDQAVHEIGHHLEDTLPEVSAMCLDFYEHRRGKEPITALRSLNPSMRHLDASAVGIKDDFARVFGSEVAPYTGRWYAPLSKEVIARSIRIAKSMIPALAEKRPVVNGPARTEILSMGLQKLYDSPEAFYDDPEYFGFLTGVLNGSLRMKYAQKTARSKM